MVRCSTFSPGPQSPALHVYVPATAWALRLDIWLYYIPISLWAAAQSKTEPRWQVNGVAWISPRLRPPPLRRSLWQVAVDAKSLWYFHDWMTAWNCTHHLDSIVMHLVCELSLKCRKLDSTPRLAFQPYTVWQENRPLFFCAGGEQAQNERLWEKVSGSITGLVFLRRDTSDALKSFQFPHWLHGSYHPPSVRPCRTRQRCLHLQELSPPLTPRSGAVSPEVGAGAARLDRGSAKSWGAAEITAVKALFQVVSSISESWSGVESKASCRLMCCRPLAIR